VSEVIRQQYPGDAATAEDMLRLAEEYRKAAHLLIQLGRKRAPLTWAPCRLSAIHAIELFLNALLMHNGDESSAVRGMQHDLGKRFERAKHGGLQLRKRTASHLIAMVGSREYLVTRYGPEMTATVSQINRLTATLDEVAKKVATIIESDGKSRVVGRGVAVAGLPRPPSRRGSAR
jgi:hypothetical protein